MVESEDWQCWEDETGDMCLLPLTAKGDDAIAVISGGRKPFLLRRRKEESRTRRFFKTKRKKVEEDVRYF